jgi:hypothetical protein
MLNQMSHYRTFVMWFLHMLEPFLGTCVEHNLSKICHQHATMFKGWVTYWIQASPHPWQCGSCQLCSPKRQSGCMVSWGRRQGKILLQQNFTDADKVNFLRAQKCTFSEGIINSHNNYILSTAKTSEQPLALFYQRTTPWNVDHHHAEKTKRPKPGRKKMGQKISVPFRLWRLQRKTRDSYRGCSTFRATCRLWASTRNRRWCNGTRYTSPQQLWRPFTNTT